MELISHGRSQARVPTADLDPVRPGGELGEEKLTVLKGTARDGIALVIRESELDPGGQVIPCQKEAVRLRLEDLEPELVASSQGRGADSRRGFESN